MGAGREPRPSSKACSGSGGRRARRSCSQCAEGRFKATLVGGNSGRNVSWLEPDGLGSVAGRRRSGARRAVRAVRAGGRLVEKLYFATYPLTRTPVDFRLEPRCRRRRRTSPRRRRRRRSGPTPRRRDETPPQIVTITTQARARGRRSHLAEAERERVDHHESSTTAGIRNIATCADEESAISAASLILPR